MKVLCNLFRILQVGFNSKKQRNLQQNIIVRGAREHNLKNFDIDIPRDQFVVITGLSGSGKSSLAFDTIYAEGQRRFLESLSAYARQFLGMMERPEVDFIDGLSPVISIDQKNHQSKSSLYCRYCYRDLRFFEIIVRQSRNSIFIHFR